MNRSGLLQLPCDAFDLRAQQGGAPAPPHPVGRVTRGFPVLAANGSRRGIGRDSLVTHHPKSSSSRKARMAMSASADSEMPAVCASVAKRVFSAAEGRTVIEAGVVPEAR